jgi:hypothetical protein
LDGRANEPSNARWEITTPPSSSYSRGGWKTPTTFRCRGFPAGVRSVNVSPRCRSCLLPNERLTSAPVVPSCDSARADEPSRQSKR